MYTGENIIKIKYILIKYVLTKYIKTKHFMAKNYYEIILYSDDINNYVRHEKLITLIIVSFNIS